MTDIEIAIRLAGILLVVLSLCTMWMLWKLERMLRFNGELK